MQQQTQRQQTQRQQTQRRWLVMKFGGTSVSSAKHWQTICDQAGERLRDGWHTLIVVSALSGVTNQLTRLGRTVDEKDRADILAEIGNRHTRLLDSLGLTATGPFRQAWQTLVDVTNSGSGLRDDAGLAMLQACGERLSSAIGQQVLHRAGLEPCLQQATDLLKANREPGDSPLSASCDAHADPEMEKVLAKQGSLHITQGFLAAGPGGTTWLLGRGGSDTSAACLASRLQAERLEIWTDVPGIFSADPRVVSDARLLQRLSYSEAQELASMGAKILHPPSVRVSREAGIPVYIRDTGRCDVAGTHIGPRSAETDAQVKGIVSRGNITLVMMENPSMWRQVGFLADAFNLFRLHGLSVDLVSTSESSVTVSLDPGRAGVDDQELLDRLVEDLSHICDVQLRTSCVSISLVGNAIRTILGRLSEALDVFQDRKVHMVTQSANDLNLTLVVDPGHADRLVQKLHQLLIAPQAQQRPEFGDSWSMMTGRDKTPVALPWWRHEATRLQTILGQQSSAYVYHLDSVRKAARRLLDLPSVDRVLYAMKANHHPDILRTLHQEGAGFDCVSMEEVRYLRSQVPGISTSDILFTPNFAERAEYLEALSAGVRTTIDNLHPLLHWPELFAGQQVFLRVDLNAGYGHHRKVITSGARSKFGIAIDHLQELQPHLKKHRIRVTGLHAHTGSGVIEAGVWGEQLQRMLSLLPMFPEVGVVDLGGGLGVPERAGQPHLDVQRVNQTLKDVLADVPVKLWLEPGRYLVAESGVLLSRVTQLKSKGEQNYVGLATGMNSLIRPALYGAFHEIVNLSRPDEPSTHKYTVVGPICESGDVLGESRFLPECHEGDILLIANAGAYGRVMSSNYNRRAPAEERVFPE